MAGSGLARALSTNAASSLTQTNSSSPASASSSAPGTKSGPAGHRTKVAEEVGPPAELTKAEDLIQKRDYAGAEPLLSKVVNDDPTNFEAWFDLGFAENGLGKIDDSIAAYRKAVAAKPDVFESNLNLGLQLAKRGQADAEQFLRAATHQPRRRGTGASVALFGACT
jgi:Tfp pilus assembly protein PilF